MSAASRTDAGVGPGEILLEGVTKRFDDVVAVDDVSITIPGGEFFSMLGPSGCGKTTTLRMIAGFEAPDAGRIVLQGADVTHVPPAKRNVNMVFQAYGLFPHMTVGENVAFGPRIKKWSREETRQRVAEAIKTVRLDGFEDRRPGQLSGGQQQRVALARALVNRPAALLLDEPLGALDLKLRKEMQLELKDLQQRTGTTFVYVTHDQEEAMTMSDRIAVMNGGVVEQLATPKELYQRPASAFVAGFIGTSNLIELRVDRRDGGLLTMDLGEGQRILAVAPEHAAGSSRTTITVRPEWIKLSTGEVGDRASHVGGTVVDVVYLGSVTQLIVLLPTGERLTVHQLNDEVGADDPRPGQQVTLHWAAEHSYVVGSEPGAAEIAAGSDVVTPDTDTDVPTVDATSS
jgi:spermidine/putrescine transport system ATP-binding protein